MVHSWMISFLLFASATADEEAETSSLLQVRKAVAAERAAPYDGSNNDEQVPYVEMPGDWSPYGEPDGDIILDEWQGSCRTEDGGCGTYRTLDLDKQQCESECIEDEACLAFEHDPNKHSCKIHTQTITNTEVVEDRVTCTIKPPEHDAGGNLEVDVPSTCSDFFGACKDGDVVTIVDTDVGITEASAHFCDKMGLPSPCTFVHWTGLDEATCFNPGPPDGCHRYRKVTYSHGCTDVLNQLQFAAPMDRMMRSEDRFDEAGVLRACAAHVTNIEVFCYGPPAVAAERCECPPDQFDYSTPATDDIDDDIDDDTEDDIEDDIEDDEGDVSEYDGDETENDVSDEDDKEEDDAHPPAVGDVPDKPPVNVPVDTPGDADQQGGRRRRCFGGRRRRRRRCLSLDSRRRGNNGHLLLGAGIGGVVGGAAGAVVGGAGGAAIGAGVGTVIAPGAGTAIGAGVGAGVGAAAGAAVGTVGGAAVGTVVAHFVEKHKPITKIIEAKPLTKATKKIKKIIAKKKFQKLKKLLR